MALKERINADLKEALLGGDKFKGETLRGLKAALLNEEVAQGKRDEGLEDATIEQIVAREVKKRNESADLYEQNGRPDSAADERREVEILSAYLPAQLSEDDLRAIVEATIKQLGANGPGDMGKVIGVVKSKVGNTASGALVAELVKQTLK
jgi:uncharacterized protein YqeY